MKYSTAKRFVQGYKAAEYLRGAKHCRQSLSKAIAQFEQSLNHNRLIGKY